MKTDDESLIRAASAVRQNAYVPYSGYFVGAAVLDEAGRVHAGCNVENTAFPQGTCAEQNAIGAMVAAGGKRIVAIAVIGGTEEPITCMPCGACRQRICEFADRHTRILLVGENDTTTSYRIEELLPASFRLPD
ncbi:MAG: cytidine deaminase [Woeseia sp.]